MKKPCSSPLIQRAPLGAAKLQGFLFFQGAKNETIICDSIGWWIYSEKTENQTEKVSAQITTVLPLCSAAWASLVLITFF